MLYLENRKFSAIYFPTWGKFQPYPAQLLLLNVIVIGGVAHDLAPTLSFALNVRFFPPMELGEVDIFALEVSFPAAGPSVGPLLARPKLV